MLRILFVTDLYPLFEDEAGIPLTLKAFCDGFVAQGETTVTVFRPNFTFNTRLRGRKVYKEGFYENDGVKIYNKNFLLPFRKSSVIKAYKKAFLKKGKEEGFDIILAHMPSGLLCAKILSEEFKIPYLASVHSSDIKVLEDFKYSIFFKERMISAYMGAECVLARSFWLKERIKKIIPNLNKPVEIIYSGLPLKETEENEKRALKEFEEGKKFNPKKAKIISVSSLIKRKNLKTLIVAYKKIKKKYPKVSLEIAGGGPLREKLEEFCTKKKIDVIFSGPIKRDEVKNKMAGADIFILPSKNETFGMVYAEALSMGLVTCCTKGSGVDGIIKDNENGFLFKPNVKGVYETLERALSLTPKKYETVSKNAFITAKMFSYENSIKNYLEKIELFRL